MSGTTEFSRTTLLLNENKSKKSRKTRQHEEFNPSELLKTLKETDFRLDCCQSNNSVSSFKAMQSDEIQDETGIEAPMMKSRKFSGYLSQELVKMDLDNVV